MSIKIYKPVADNTDSRGNITFVFEREDVKDFEVGTHFLAKNEIWEVIGHSVVDYNIDKKLHKRKDELEAFRVKKVKI